MNHEIEAYEGELRKLRKKQQWVGLTDDEITEIESLCDSLGEWVGFLETARMIEEKLKEKNT